MNVAGIVLHRSAQQALEQYLQAPTHALLLASGVGTGKTYIAEALVAQLLGADNLENQAYFQRVAPEKDSISIEQIRKLIGFFQLKVPGTAAIRRVAIIQDADTMGTEAQNALLKLLEEPPEDSVLILTSSHPQELLQTIRSRTPLLQLAQPDEVALMQHFATLGYDAGAISNSLLRTGGNIAQATAILAGKEAQDDTIAMVKNALGGTSYDRMLLVDSLSKQKDVARTFVDTLATVAMVSLQAAAHKGAATVDRWKNILTAAHTAQQAFDRNGNPKLVLTELMLSL